MMRIDRSTRTRARALEARGSPGGRPQQPGEPGVVGPCAGEAHA